jgi:hypothetical protein
MFHSGNRDPSDSGASRLQKTPPPKSTAPVTTLVGLGGQRNLERYSFSAQVLVLPFDGRKAAFWAMAEDISHEGVFLSSSQRLDENELVMLKIYTERGLLQVSARVRHVLFGYGFGCKFIDVDHRQRRALSTLVALSAAAPHQRRGLH